MNSNNNQYRKKKLEKKLFRIRTKKKRSENNEINEKVEHKCCNA